MEVQDTKAPKPLDHTRISSISRLIEQFCVLEVLLERLHIALKRSGPEAADDHEHKPADVRIHARNVLGIIGEYNDNVCALAPRTLTHETTRDALRELKTLLKSLCRELRELFMKWPDTLFSTDGEISSEVCESCHQSLQRIGDLCTSADVKVVVVLSACQYAAASLRAQLDGLQSSNGGEPAQPNPGKPK